MRPFLLTLLVALMVVVGPAAAAPKWNVWVEQGGKTIAFKGEVHLKKAPFAFIFEGERDDAYALIASVDREELEGRVRRAKDDQAAGGRGVALFSAAFVGAVDTDPAESKYLIVNDRGVLNANEFTSQLWVDEAGGGHSFQKLERSGRGRLKATREVVEILMNRGFKPAGEELPVTKFAPGALYFWFGRQPATAEVVEDKAFASIVFD